MPYSSTSALPPAVKAALKTTKERQAFVAAFNNALKQGHSEEEAFKIAYAAARSARGEKSDSARQFSADERKKAAKKGQARSDGSFPIKNRQDLLNAIRAVGRASNPAAAKAHIKRRAKALGLESLLPDSWKKDSAMSMICCPGACDRPFLNEVALANHQATCVHIVSDPAVAEVARAEVEQAATPPGDNAPKAPPGAPPPATGTGEQPSGGSLHLKLALEHMRMFAASETQDTRRKSALMLLRPMRTLVEDSSPAPGAGTEDPSKPGAPAAKKVVAKKATTTQSPGARGGSQSRTGSRPAAAKTDPKRKVKVSVEAALLFEMAMTTKDLTCREPGCGRPFVSQDRLVEHAEAVHTHNDVRQMVQAALRMKIEAARPMGYANSRVYVYVADIADDWVVYEVGEGLYKSAYSIKDKTVTLGDAKPVRSRRVYEEIKVGV